jgi:hypothetical protein
VAFWRPFRRPNRNLGTLGGNPSVLDEVNAEGPPVFAPTVGGVVAGIEYWDEERAVAVEADLAADVNTDFQATTDAENASWDALAESNERLAHDNTEPDQT